MRLTDGKKTVEITIRTWNGSQWSWDWSNDYFQGARICDRMHDMYMVDDVDYCIDMANDTTEEGARGKYDEEAGTWVEDENVDVDVTDITDEYKQLLAEDEEA